MRLKTSHWLLAVAMCAMAAPAPAAAAEIAHGARVNARAAARACVHGRALGASLGAADAVFLKHFVPCVLRAERSQYALGHRQDRPLSGTVMSALTQFTKLPYLAQHRVHQANRPGLLRANNIAVGACRRRGFHEALYQFAWADTTAPPPPTPLEYATLLGRWFQSPRAVVRSAAARFAVAAARGLSFRSNDLGAAEFGVIAFVCK